MTIAIHTVNNSQNAPEQEDDEQGDRLFTVAGNALDEDEVETE